MTRTVEGLTGRSPAQPAALSRSRTGLALFALALGGFAIGCTEFAAMGLLPDIARDLLPGLPVDEANARTGGVVSAYAAGVVVGAPTIAAVSARFPRKQLLLALLVAFTLATVATALLPSFGWIAAARFAAGLPHGAYFGVASLVAASLMGRGARGKGVAFVLGGLTIANVIGVPVVTAVGQAAGWRIAYVAVAALFAATLLAVALWVPRQPGNPSFTVANELALFRSGRVWVTLIAAAVGFGGLFAAYTFISPITTEVAGLDVSIVPAVLVVFGIGMTIGNAFGGWYVDRSIPRALMVTFAVTLTALLGLLFTAESAVGVFVFAFLIGAGSSALSPAIQVRVMDVAPNSPTIAAAVNHSALNAGNAIGAALGGVGIAAGLGYLAPVEIGVALTATGMLIAGTALLVERRRALALR